MDATREATEITAIVLVDVALIVLVAQVAGGAFRRIGQPAVIGEIVAGILIGPTLLGALPGDPSAELFPPDVRPYLKVIGDLGLILFMFMVGLQLDLRRVRSLKRAGSISAASVAVPFALGLLLAAWLHPSHDTVAGAKVGFVPFALFIGAAMSVTAFPVLARILLERGMHGTHIGALVLACAAVDDVIGWSVLAVALASLRSQGELTEVPAILLATIAFAFFMALIARPLALDRLVAHYHRAAGLTPGLLAAILCAVGICAWVTEAIGAHFVFGAFALGVVFPRDRTSELRARLNDQLAPLVTVLLLPVFFVLPGLGMNVRTLGWEQLGEFALVLATACGGKFLGAAGMARLQGLDWRQSAAIGTLMNTRGVMELVVLNVGLAAGVLDLELYTVFVLMAIATTLMTGPLLRRIYPRGDYETRAAAREEEAPLERRDPTR